MPWETGEPVFKQFWTIEGIPVNNVHQLTQSGNQRKYLDWLGKKLGYKDKEDWYLH